MDTQSREAGPRLAHLKHDRALARIDLAAVESNCGALKERIGVGCELCAVVKADGYGHGAAWCARAAIAGGATRLAVATAEEAQELRRHGLREPILVMGALNTEDVALVLEAGADFVVWREAFAHLAARKAEAVGTRARLHVKLDTGMGRLGTPDSEEAHRLLDLIGATERLELAGLMTHLATADEPDSGFFEQQLERFRPLADEVRQKHPGALVHAANSAAVFRSAKAQFDMVRCGIAIYGLDPFHDDPVERGLRPALTLESYVADVKVLQPGDSAGYGRTWTADRETRIAVLPIGYGDGYRRGLSNNADVIVRGRRRPVVGTVSMDNITVEVGDDSEVRSGDVAVLIGSASGERITAEDLARRLGTINYEVTCAIAPRVRRLYHRGGDEQDPSRPD